MLSTTVAQMALPPLLLPLSWLLLPLLQLLHLYLLLLL
jgi:hypothetical protein